MALPGFRTIVIHDHDHCFVIVAGKAVNICLLLTFLLDELNHKFFKICIPRRQNIQLSVLKIMVNRKSTPKKRITSKGKITRIVKMNNTKVNIKILKDIKRLQATTENVIPRLPFSKVIREVLQEQGTGDHRIQVEALRALQEAAELYLVQLFEDANKCAFHAKRVTLKPSDMNLVLQVRGCQDPGFN